MKERIVLTGNMPKNFYVNSDDIKATREQLPETFEELKELCKDIIVDLKVCKNGRIYYKEHCIAQNRTPQQMWEIIKNLMEAE